MSLVLLPSQCLGHVSFMLSFINLLISRSTGSPKLGDIVHFTAGVTNWAILGVGSNNSLERYWEVGPTLLTRMRNDENHSCGGRNYVMKVMMLC